ncbi:hypothetical protein [Hyphococcus sp.]|uniref:hypothetical protein n=1 Tax=Hyphococcus sp. TaxID=2038636 RepID=UPI0020815708|nr:MAG: hypothetical protein DHS20C04_26210 [Marinicaulis sp.]
MIEGFFWSLGQALHVGWPVGFSVVLLVSAVFLVLGWRMYPRDERARRRLPLLFVLPAFWVFIAFWGSAFPYHWGSGKPQNPEWMIHVVEAAMVGFLLFWLGLLVKLKGARIVTLLFGGWNLYFLLVMGLLAAMSLSGNYI